MSYYGYHPQMFYPGYPVYYAQQQTYQPQADVTNETAQLHIGGGTQDGNDDDSGSEAATERGDGDEQEDGGDEDADEDNAGAANNTAGNANTSTFQLVPITVDDIAENPYMQWQCPDCGNHPTDNNVVCPNCNGQLVDHSALYLTDPEYRAAADDLLAEQRANKAQNNGEGKLEAQTRVVGGFDQ